MIENITTTSVEKHFVTQSAPDIDALLTPLKAYGITHLTVGILRNNLIHQNSLEILTNDPSTFSTYIQEGFYKNIIGLGPDHYIPCNALTRPIAESCPVMGEFYALWSNTHGYANSIDLVRKFDDHCEIYYFATEPTNHHIENFYLNNINLLDNFILSFRESAHDILQKSSQNAFYLPNGGDSTPIASTHWQNAHLTTSIQPSLTERQKLCAHLLKQGCHTKEIAKHLHISPRTVEKFIAQLKNKYQAKSINELLLLLK